MDNKFSMLQKMCSLYMDYTVNILMDCEIDKVLELLYFKIGYTHTHTHTHTCLHAKSL